MATITFEIDEETKRRMKARLAQDGNTLKGALTEFCEHYTSNNEGGLYCITCMEYPIEMPECPHCLGKLVWDDGRMRSVQIRHRAPVEREKGEQKNVPNSRAPKTV